jgi:2-pyrone-4,6-dicarboxylate lactonase
MHAMEEPKQTFNPRPSKSKLDLPRGSCDAHFHVFGPQAQFPFVQDRAYTPADAPKEELFALHEFLGIDCGVVVQPAIHGFDNSAAADLIADKKDSYVGVALLPVTVDGAELKGLHQQGFRGVRFNYMRHLGTPPPIDEVIKLAARLAPFGWHLQIHMESALIEQLGPKLKLSPVPVVIDHMGRIDAGNGLDQAPFRNLLKLMQDKKIWVKVSGCERASREGEPYADAVPFARKLVEECGDRVLWGTDWPHPNLKAIPDDGVLVDLVAQMAPTEGQRQALLVDNPQRLYKFGEAT